MSRDELAAQIHALYDVIEVNNIGAVPLQVATETLKLINPALTGEQAQAIAQECDARGKQLLQKEDFSNGAHLCLQNTDPSDSINIVRDLTVRMRVAFRKRYLMYDAPANSPPQLLLENSKAVSSFRELYDFVAHGTEELSRTDLKRLVSTLLPDYPVDANNVVKAALGDRETDCVGFFEFMMVLQPATSRRCLSDMLNLAEKHFKGTGTADMHPAPKKTPIQTQKDRSLFGSTNKQPTEAPLPAFNSRLAQELDGYRVSDAAAERRFAESVGHRPIMDAMPVVPEPIRNQGLTLNNDASLEREIARLRLHNEELQHQLVVAKMQGSGQGRDSLGRDGRSASASMQETEMLRERNAHLERELKLAKAQLAISSEAAELASLLRQTDNTRGAIRDYFTEESVFVGKHQYLRETAKVYDDGVSPLSTIFGQYDLIVLGYQGLYRDLKAKYDARSAKKFDAVKAAKSIVPQSPIHSPAPSVRRASPTVRSSPVRWQDLDRPPTQDMRHSHTLADPLLTDRERHELRAKLAAQMRGSARHFTPTRAGSSPAPREPSMVPTFSTSQGSIKQLQSIAGRAGRY